MSALRASISRGNACRQLTFLNSVSGRDSSILHVNRRQAHTLALSWIMRQSSPSSPMHHQSVSGLCLSQRCIATSSARSNADAASGSGTLSTIAAGVGQVEPKLGLKYRCKICDHENFHTFSKASYESGVVIVQCQSCSSHHLVADNLGWFADKDRQKSVKGVLESRAKVDKSAVRSSKQQDGTIEVEVKK